MTELSPAAQAIDGALAACIQLQGEIIRARPLAAAALEALADQVVPEVDLHVSVAADLLPKDIGAAKWSARYEVRSEILALAAELKNH